MGDYSAEEATDIAFCRVLGGSHAERVDRAPPAIHWISSHSSPNKCWRSWMLVTTHVTADYLIDSRFFDAQRAMARCGMRGTCRALHAAARPRYRRSGQMVVADGNSSFGL
eukprot:6179602-Pleurochrysis_carterae.AAC.5